jgi:hypothetical protein
MQFEYYVFEGIKKDGNSVLIFMIIVVDVI